MPLLLRAYELWAPLEHATSHELLRLTGLLMVGRRLARSSQVRLGRPAHSLPFDRSLRLKIRSRFPMLKILDEEMGIYEPDGGVLIRSGRFALTWSVAEAAGAHIHFEAAMESWEPTAAGFSVRLANGTTVTTRALVLSLGAWFKDALEKLGVTVRVQRNVQAWFESAADVLRHPISRRFSSTGKVCLRRSMAFLISATE